MARLAEPSLRDARVPYTPEADRLTHIAYWPLPFLLQQLDLAAQPRGGILRRRGERWPPRSIALTDRAKWDRSMERSRREADRVRAAVRTATGR